MKIRILLFLLACSNVSFSQQVKVETDTTNIRIGEQFLFQITISDTANVILPEKLENLKNLEVVEDFKIDTFKNSLIKKYLMTGFDSGAFYIPTQQIFIRNRAYLTDSVLINVIVYFIITRKKAEITEEEIIAGLPPYEEAIERLQKLDNKLLWQNNEVKKYYSELTEIVRAYIEKELKGTKTKK